MFIEVLLGKRSVMFDVVWAYAPRRVGYTVMVGSIPSKAADRALVQAISEQDL
ncbi:unannotated protein [freshwater metagenome]|uniref:Unannotated protein n=1 Tax=freshwater metagenome TaxID=449393 RepID=A0A6J7GST4_9ZZZZ